MKSTKDIIAPNRTEDFGYDVWEQFVVPPYFDKLELSSSFKPKVFIGGRGCGKTMLLRYLSHQSLFSLKRDDVSEESLHRIGLYWKFDTQFARLLDRRGLSEDEWSSAFTHLASLTLGKELLNSLNSLERYGKIDLEKSALDRLDFGQLNGFDPDLPQEFSKLLTYFEDGLNRFYTWANNIKIVPQPRFLPGTRFIAKIIEILQQQLDILSMTTYFVYLDEYENFLEYQQRIINTWIKHSERPLIFNIAMKRNSFRVRKTTGEESLSDIHDFRTHDLDVYTGSGFEIFGAEVLFMRLAIDGTKDLPITPSNLRSVSNLESRTSTQYRSSILSAANRLLPSKDYEDLAKDIFTDVTLSAQLNRQITSALKRRKSPIDAKEFIRQKFPSASLVCTALLNRIRLSPKQIIRELNLLEQGKPNQFSSGWIHNNLVGCLLLLYAPLPRPCPVFSGYPRLCQIAGGNLRYLLEMINKSLSESGTKRIKKVSIEQQAEAARSASSEFLLQVKHCGPKGNQLYIFVLRIGELFKLAQLRPSQSETEINHFSVDGGLKTTDKDLLDFFDEALKYSVLIDVEGTKQKSIDDFEPRDYVLNPIFSPYFHISFRRKRKLSLSLDELKTIVGGTHEKFKEIIKKYSSAWSAPTENLSSLFTEETDAF